MKYEQLLVTIIAVVIGSLIASYLDFILLEDLRQQKRLQYEMMVYGSF
jgi:uncharacterized membrane-anchored protein YhcB (DUF1043 family)